MPTGRGPCTRPPAPHYASTAPTPTPLPPHLVLEFGRAALRPAAQHAAPPLHVAVPPGLHLPQQRPALRRRRHCPFRRAVQTAVAVAVAVRSVGRLCCFRSHAFAKLFHTILNLLLGIYVNQPTPICVAANVLNHCTEAAAIARRRLCDECVSATCRRHATVRSGVQLVGRDRGRGPQAGQRRGLGQEAVGADGAGAADAGGGGQSGGQRAVEGRGWLGGVAERAGRGAPPHLQA